MASFPPFRRSATWRAGRPTGRAVAAYRRIIDCRRPSRPRPRPRRAAAPSLRSHAPFLASLRSRRCSLRPLAFSPRLATLASSACARCASLAPPLLALLRWVAWELRLARGSAPPVWAANRPDGCRFWVCVSLREPPDNRVSLREPP